MKGTNEGTSNDMDIYFEFGMKTTFLQVTQTYILEH